MATHTNRNNFTAASYSAPIFETLNTAFVPIRQRVLYRLSYFLPIVEKAHGTIPRSASTREKSPPNAASTVASSIKPLSSNRIEKSRKLPFSISFRHQCIHRRKLLSDNPENSGLFLLEGEQMPITLPSLRRIGREE